MFIQFVASFVVAKLNGRSGRVGPEFSLSLGAKVVGPVRPMMDLSAVLLALLLLSVNEYLGGAFSLASNSVCLIVLYCVRSHVHIDRLLLADNNVIQTSLPLV